ncbi:MAG: hypothetical protein SA339_08385 [Methanomassiliicoccus sp.]|nr:hypothetical protein [Methanomassiliicoccus sp.]
MTSHPSDSKASKFVDWYRPRLPWVDVDEKFESAIDAEEYTFTKGNEIRKSRGLKEVPKEKLRTRWSGHGRIRDYYFGNVWYGSVVRDIGPYYDVRRSE